ncbi:fumarylacetoacetate hydrolase family protein [Paracoccus rhizosphaerae]|uniref:fumarylacetoacetate hydrolase family protein n=1 Tax=Paracoccus rhizosphaerae TaxID=1133347 RepID=UPI00361BAAEA
MDLWLDVDGQRRQTDNTITMFCGMAHLASYTSQFTTLDPGDIITTVTSPGVRLAVLSRMIPLTLAGPRSS